MAEQPPTTPQSATGIPNTPNPANTEAAKAGADPARQASTTPDQAGNPSARTDNDPMRDLLEHLQRARASLANADPNLAGRIDILTQQGADLQQRAQPEFRHQLAYAVQDLEKSFWPLPMADELRSEMTHLAAMAPGLENEHMQALMRMTASLQDTRLIRDLRQIGTEIGRQTDQNTLTIQSSIEALENRVRLSQRPIASRAEQEATSGPSAAEPHPSPSGGTSVRDGASMQQDRAARHAQAPARDPLHTILAGMRPNDQARTAPWDPPPTPMAGRLAAFESRIQDERALGRAEKSGRTALNAVDAFRSGEGAIVMNRIREAARSEPGGLAAVLSEMRQGGRLADLRQQFNNALETDRGAAAAYDKAAAALARYGQDRVGIEQVIARRPDAANLNARFEQMDTQIGAAAAGTPSRRDGKSMVDDLAQKAAELLQRAVDGVKSIFNHSPSADATTRAAPAPSMSL